MRTLIARVHFDAASSLAFGYFNAGRDSVTKLANMGNNPNEPAAISQLEKLRNSALKCLAIKSTEAFIDKEGIDPDTPGERLDNICEAKREGQRRLKALSTRERCDGSTLTGVLVFDE